MFCCLSSEHDLDTTRQLTGFDHRTDEICQCLQMIVFAWRAFANLTGTIPANGTYVIEDLNSVLTGFTGAPRATLNVSVAGPNTAIQGLYQIVNPDKGSISNHVLVRPGSN